MVKAPRNWCYGLACICLLLGPWIGGSSPPATAATLPPGLYLLQHDHTGLSLAWIAPPVQLQPRDDGTVEILAEGYPQTGQPGFPRLPYTAVLLALPTEASPQLQVISATEVVVELPGDIPSAPWPSGLRRNDRGEPIGGSFAPSPLSNQTVLSTSVTLQEIGIVRGVRLARLTLYPARPQGGQLRVIRSLRLEVRWPEHRIMPSGILDPLVEAVRRAVINPWDAIPTSVSFQKVGGICDPPDRRGCPEPLPGTAYCAPNVAAPRGCPEPLPADPTANEQALIEVAAPGLYRVTYEDVAGLGLVEGDPANLHLFQGTEAVAFSWEGDDDPLFEAGESLLFYAEPRFSRWSPVDVYWLVAGATPGLHIGIGSADPTGLPGGVPWVEQSNEEDHLYTPDCFCGSLPAGHDGDHWAWQVLRRPDPEQDRAAFSFQIRALDPTQPASLTLWFIGYTALPANPDHRVDVALNGSSLNRVEWDGKRSVSATLPLPPGLLQEGNNILSLTLPGIPNAPIEGMWLDAFAVRHARSTLAQGSSLHFEGESNRQAYTVALSDTVDLRAYDISDPRQPQQLCDWQWNGEAITLGDPPEGGPQRYLLVSAAGIRRPQIVRAPEDPQSLSGTAPSSGANVLILSHPAFADALGPLLNLHQAQGLSTTLVNVLGVYDLWGEGRGDPQAIRNYITEAYESWSPRPSYVLLVGDGSFDPKGHRPDSPTTFIPPYLADVDPWAGETAADNRYVCVDGDDALPDMLIGRLPVGTLEEAQAAVTKIVRYETSPLPGPWNASVLLVADDTDAAGDFADSAEQHAAIHVESPFTVTRHYCVGSSPYQSDCPTQEASAIRSALLNDWNQGALLIQFIGHSSWHQWAVEQFLHLFDLALLHNDRSLPIVLEMTCFTGAFHRPETTLDEDMITLPEGGAVAVWGPTGLGVSTGHDLLSDGFFQAVFAGEVETVGEATLAGKLALAGGGQSLDLLDTFVLLGDPALRINRTLRPWPFQAFLPLLMNVRMNVRTLER